MFNLFLKRRGPVVNIFKRFEVKRQINSNTLVKRPFPRRVGVVRNLGKQYRLKHTSVDNSFDRKYSTLPEPVEASITRKVFVSNEDIFAHSILEGKEVYSATLAKSLPVLDDEVTENEVSNYLSKSWKDLPIPEIIQAFKRISQYASKHDENILDEKYERFIKYLVANCKQFTDSEIGDVLLSIELWPITYTRHDSNFKCLFQALDAECSRRALDWSVENLLLFSDYWYRIRLYKYTEFANFVIRKLGNKPNRMTPANLVQYMFYVNSSRMRPKDMYNLEYRMETSIDQLDLNELSILAMGFFKSKAPIRNSGLLVKIIHRLIQEIDTVNEISLAAFMKIIRYSYTMQNECGIVWQLLVSTVPQIPRLSLQALIHIVATVVKMRISYPELLTSVAERFNHEIKDARIKDLERLVLALTSVNFTPDIQPNIFQSIVEEISAAHRRPDLERYQKSLALLLQYLSVVELYPKDLIAFVLDPQNLKSVYGPSPFDLSHSILVLDLNVDVEVPDYTGPRLTSRTRSIISKGYVNVAREFTGRDLSFRHEWRLEMMNTCQEILGSSEMVHSDWLLPHFKEADIIVCLDKNNSPLPVKSILSEIPLGDIKRKPEIYPEGCRWLALVLGAPNCYIRNSAELLGKDFVKVRQLAKIGYEPIMIPFFEWSVNERIRKNYLKQILFK